MWEITIYSTNTSCVFFFPHEDVLQSFIEQPQWAIPANTQQISCEYVTGANKKDIIH